LDGLTTQAALGMCIVAAVYRRIDPGASCTFTSVNDSKHGIGSLHHCREGKYTDGLCRAFDVRTKDVTANKLYLVQEVKASLGPDFDVVLEDPGGPNEHMHVEHDPKENNS
jgi:hypothetical protein